MSRARTQGDNIRRLIYLRVLISVLLLSVFVLIAGNLPLTIISGLLAAFNIAITTFWIRTYRRADRARLETPVDPNLRPTLRYPKPDKDPHRGG
jgi:Flp pilus assembly protein TadB